MPCTFDSFSRTFTLSVRELAREDGPGPIGYDRIPGWSQLSAGALLHQRLLQARCATQPGYRAEVWLEQKIAVAEWTALLHGRMDGCIQQEGGRWLVEEFKSCDPSFHRGGPRSAFPRDRRQLLIYCHLWRLAGHSPVAGRVVYVDPAGDREWAMELEEDAEVAEGEVLRRLHQLVEDWKIGEVRREEKRAAADQLPFPHGQPRPGQQVLIDRVSGSLRQQEHLLAEAPTGSGKTAASLHPALQETLRQSGQLVFLTSKTTQQKMAVDCLQSMNEGPFRSMQLRAKESMCANDRVICHEDFCPYARDFPGKLKSSGLLGRLEKENRHLDPDLVFAEARREMVCPFAVQLELAERMDALVADYNYVFDPGSALGHLAPEHLSRAILVVDEAHNLPDRARKIYSPELTEQLLNSVFDFCSHSGADLFDPLKPVVLRLLEWLRTLAAELPKDLPLAEIPPPFAPLRDLWAEWLPAFALYLARRERAQVVEDDPVFDLHSSLVRLQSVANLYGPGFCSIIGRSEKGIRFAFVCLDPSQPLRPIFRAVSSAIFLSATLSPLETFSRQLGLEKKRTSQCQLPSPFPRENRKIMVLPQVRTSYQARGRHLDEIARLIVEMGLAHAGNNLVLFPSYQFLSSVESRLKFFAGRVLVQKTGSSREQREEIFRQLQSSDPGGVLLLGVLGGVFAEGVDYPGELLTGVFIISPALPQISPERELLRRYFDQSGESGFEFAYLQPGMTRVIQAAGRLIRSETDRGVIALICGRFLEDPYWRYLPRDWYDESPAELICRNPAGEITRFFTSSKG